MKLVMLSFWKANFYESYFLALGRTVHKLPINLSHYALTCYLKKTLKQYIEVYYRIFISVLFGEIFCFEIFSCQQF